MTDLLTRAADPLAWSGPANGIDEALVCRRVVAVTHDVTSFELSSPSGRAFAFEAGQYVVVSATVDGQRVERCYTISSPPTCTDAVTITVKRLAGGPMSNWLIDHLTPGDRLHVTGPLGRFTMGGPAGQKLLLLSAGSGITPVMSMLRTMLERHHEALDIVFAHSARSPRDIVFRAELERIAADRSDVRIATICEHDSSDEGWDGNRGRLTLPMLLEIAADASEREVFTCGPAAYMDSVRDLLRRASADPARCHEESFELGLDPVPPVAVAGPAFHVEFRRSGRAVECAAGTSVLQAALAAGVPLPSSCGEGVCGTCKTTVLAGTVDMQHAGGIRPREIAQGKALLCCSTPLENLVLDA